MATLERICCYPVKSLDPISVDVAALTTGGGLEWDRRYAMVDADGEYVNGKRERRVHRLRSRVTPSEATVTLCERGSDDGRTFHLEDDRETLTAWLTEFFGYEVRLRSDDDGGFPDDTEAAGPTVISQATLERVASWYDGVGALEMQRRLRPNLVVGGVDAFWEDRLYERPGRVVPFSVGDVTLHGVNPCQRCVVPTRDPDTGESTPGFRERFLERRRATLPAWATDAWFDHYFRLMVNTRVPSPSGGVLAVGDEVSVGTSRRDPCA
ncbi:MOSC domain-containing protein [Natronobiforma cellulositropha]|uniref:MOSC domain-containing protein n=1 Tax=Natronobiforma cellulositropha TaxID=1679076 RepID=UPI0021D5FCC9|nr:MOSC N-terminal beta barrel domain-containing protein [Natronobiforma cellulositropha]